MQRYGFSSTCSIAGSFKIRNGISIRAQEVQKGKSKHEDMLEHQLGGDVGPRFLSIFVYEIHLIFHTLHL